MRLKNIKKHLAGWGIIAMCGTASAQQPELPEKFSLMKEPIMAQQCLYQLVMSTKVGYDMAVAMKNEEYMKKLPYYVYAIEIWRGKAPTLSDKDIRRSGDFASKLSVSEVSEQKNYCVWMASKYYELLTPAQQKIIKQRALKRIDDLEAGNPADLSSVN